MISPFVCPLCHSAVETQTDALCCASCGRDYPYCDGVADFSTRSHYWNQLTEEQMGVLLEISRTHGYRYGVEKILGPFADKYLVSYVLDQNRADFRAVLPITPETDVLDLGSGWGGVACSLAPTCRTITVADTNPHNLRFIRLRSEQSGLNNLNTVRIDPLDDARLPFADASFDVVLLNGVLEYVGTARRELPASEVQRLCLAEVKRLLKPGGVVYIGIENRFSYHYFRGTPDHSHVRYTSLLPRPMANMVTWLRRHEPYRTYTYSYGGYRQLLTSAGFATPEIYLAYPSYREPKFILSGDNERAIGYFVGRHLAYIRNRSRRKVAETLFQHLPLSVSSRAIRQIFDSYLVVAGAAP